MSKASVLVEQATGAGFGSVFAKFAELNARADELDRQMTVLRVAAESERAKVANRLAAGEQVEPSEVTSAGVRLSVWGFDGAAALAYVQAAAACRRDAESSAAAAVPRLHAAMAAEAAAVAEQSAKAAVVLPDSVQSDRDAIRARGDVAHAWTDLSGLYARWQELHALDEFLRRVEWVDRYDATYKRDPWGLFLRYRQPERLPEGWGNLAQERVLAAAVAAGAEPGLYLAGDAKARRRAVYGRDVMEVHTQPLGLPMVQPPPVEPLSPGIPFTSVNL